MIIKTYTLTGDKGTTVRVTASINQHGVATRVEMEILAAANSKIVDAIGTDDGRDLIVGRCIDGMASNGDQWTVAIESNDGATNDGSVLTHADLAQCPVYTEAFTFAVNETPTGVTENDVKQALEEITPAGLFDVCRAFDQCLTTKNGSRVITNIGEADQLDHDDVNRDEVINQLMTDPDYTWIRIAEYLEL